MFIHVPRPFSTGHAWGIKAWWSNSANGFPLTLSNTALTGPHLYLFILLGWEREFILSSLLRDTNKWPTQAALMGLEPTCSSHTPCLFVGRPTTGFKYIRCCLCFSTSCQVVIHMWLYRHGVSCIGGSIPQDAKDTRWLKLKKKRCFLAVTHTVSDHTIILFDDILDIKNSQWLAQSF